MTSRWEEPWDTLKLALHNFEKEGKIPQVAIDLGCGAAKDTPYLIQRGWTVIGVDIEKSAESYIRKKLQPQLQKNFTFVCSSFEEMLFNQKFLLINASCSLPYCSPAEFNRFMQEMTDAILPGGRFAGHFFGKNDEWASNPKMTFVTKEEILEIFQDFIIELLEEKEWEGKSGSSTKHWHSYKVVAKKK